MLSERGVIMNKAVTKTKDARKAEERQELIVVLAEISNVTQRLAARLALLEWQRNNGKETAK
jgi:hypothetical protein